MTPWYENLDIFPCFVAKVADCCPLLEDLDVTGSFGITNLGVQWFCTGTYNPNHLYHGAPGKVITNLGLVFSNFSCMFLNPNMFFQYELF